MDELTYFMEAQHLPKPFRKRLRDFFHQTQDYARAEGFDELFLRMSDRLRSETAQLVARDSLSKIWYFNSANPRWQVEADYLGSIALYLRPSVYEVHERIHMDKLTVIVKGQVRPAVPPRSRRGRCPRYVLPRPNASREPTVCRSSHELVSWRACLRRTLESPLGSRWALARTQVWQGVRIFASGGVLGIDSIIEDRHEEMRDMTPAHCLSFVQVNAITRSQLFALAESYPKAKAALTRAGRYMFVRAGMLAFYRRHVKGNQPLPPTTSKVADVVVDAMVDQVVGEKGGGNGGMRIDSAYYASYHNNRLVETTAAPVRNMHARRQSLVAPVPRAPSPMGAAPARLCSASPMEKDAISACKHGQQVGERCSVASCSTASTDDLSLQMTEHMTALYGQMAAMGNAVRKLDDRLNALSEGSSVRKLRKHRSRHTLLDRNDGQAKLVGGDDDDGGVPTAAQAQSPEMATPVLASACSPAPAARRHTRSRERHGERLQPLPPRPDPSAILHLEASSSAPGAATSGLNA